MSGHFWDTVWALVGHVFSAKGTFGTRVFKLFGHLFLATNNLGTPVGHLFWAADSFGILVGHFWGTRLQSRVCGWGGGDITIPQKVSGDSFL